MSDHLAKRQARRRMLQLLADGPAVVEDRAGGTVLRGIGSDTVRRLRVGPSVLTEAIGEGLAVRLLDGTLALTEVGRLEIGGDRDDHLAATVARSIAGPEGDTQITLVNDAESPLAWLNRRRDRDGNRMIAPSSFAAGERLRIEFTRACLMPSVTSNWRTALGGGGSARGSAAELTDAALAARERVRRALTVVGPDLAGVLIDVCCFLKGLETVEAERRWPPRSAKVVLTIALARLADHYGMAESVVAPEGSGRIRQWGTDDFRPEISR
jgi:hypothetical protein